MQRAIGVCLLLLSAFPTAAAEPVEKVAARPWNHELSDLKPDPRAVFGKLDNGLRYVIMPSKAAPARASMRMLVLAGSGMEEDDQQGVAHFLEHMAFNGTKHFPAGETFEYFQRLGMAFGAHTNALTQVDHTVYHLELPRANEELTGDGLKLFRDFLDGMLLDAKEIEKERGVVLSEQLARNTPVYRSAVGILKSSLAGTKAAERMPMGKSEIVRTAPRKRFVDFYETWYTPGRTIIVAVGDFDPAMVERGIRTHFADARARHGEAADVSMGKLQTGGRPAARYAPVPDAGATTVSISRATPVSPEIENEARQRTDIVDALVDRMFNKRLQRLTEMKDTLILGAAMADERLYNLADREHISARCRPENWSTMVGVLEQEMRRANLHGFTDAELAAAKTHLATIFQLYVEQEDMRQPSDLADEIVKSINERSVFAHPIDIKPLVCDFLPNVSKADCNARFRLHWDAKDLEISVTGDADLKNDAAERILEAFASSARRSVDATVDAETKEFAYTDFGPAGEIVKRREQEDLGVVQAVFANNVRVNIKSTPLEKNQVRTIIRFGGGMLELPEGKPGLQHFADAAFISGGLKKLTLNELNRKLEGKYTSVMFGVGDDAFNLSGGCITPSLELQLQLCAAYLTEPAYRPETEREFFSAMDGLRAQRDHTLEGTMRYDGAAFLRSEDPRYTLPSQEALHRLKLSDVEAFLAKPLAEGFMEVTIVGDVEPGAALKLVAKTIGALPKRAESKPDFAAARQMKFPTGVKSKQFQYATDTARAVTTICWPVPGARNTDLNRRLFVLKLVLADRLRLKLREELGAAYSPEVLYFSNDAYPDYGFIAAQLLVEPAALAQVGDVVTDVAAELAAGSISDDEFSRALNPMIGQIDAQRRDNGYWLGAICDCQERPEVLDMIRSKKQGYSTMPKADVEKLAKQYLSRDGSTTVIVAPKVVASAPSGK